ncbi:hypothetical protein EYF80_045203 [Liparis tanakae]|uniref:Uncharacterized protein n=1 Tax=Liparis tanakae TaxID=230148 RepID=A0A4Z2FUA5_9TELE|nr:hypothetical protein EYF80_045203 [Liparis tanakae]
MLNEGGKNSPAETTSSIGTPISKAMNPSTENTTKPAKILVALFRQHSTKQSLQHTDNNKPALSRRRRGGALNVLHAEVANNPGQQETPSQVPVNLPQGHVIGSPQHAVTVGERASMRI